MAVLGNKTFLSDTSTYNSSLSSYWSQKEKAIEPSCVVQPASTTDVAVLVETLAVHNNCSFAIPSGGHNPNAGIETIQEGVTVDLGDLNAVVISDDSTTVSVGPGATWDAVYSILDPMNLTVAGGRQRGVGVGGLTLGGGISFISPRV